MKFLNRKVLNKNHIRLSWDKGMFLKRRKQYSERYSWFERVNVIDNIYRLRLHYHASIARTIVDGY